MSTISKGITATWWYTAAGVVSLQVLLVLIWTGAIGATQTVTAILVFFVGGLIWAAASVPLLVRYRHRHDAVGPAPDWRIALVPLLIALAYGVVCGAVSGLWIVAALPLLHSLMLLNWPRGVRLRLVVAVTIVLAALWFVDLRGTIAVGDDDAARAW